MEKKPASLPSPTRSDGHIQHSSSVRGSLSQDFNPAISTHHLDVALVASVMPSVSVSLNQVARAGSGARSNYCALLPANQCAADSPCDAANEGTLRSTVVMPPALCKARADERAEQQCDAQNCYNQSSI